MIDAAGGQILAKRAEIERISLRDQLLDLRFQDHSSIGKCCSFAHAGNAQAACCGTRWAAETATGFGKKSRRVVPKSHRARGRKTKLARKEPDQARTRRHRQCHGESWWGQIQEDRRTVPARSP